MSCFPAVHVGTRDEAQHRGRRSVPVRAPHGGCVDTGLRRGRRKPCSASAATSSPHDYRDGLAAIGCGAARGYAKFHGDGKQYHKHRRHLGGERDRRGQ